MADLAEVVSGIDATRVRPQLTLVTNDGVGALDVALVHDYLSERGGAERVAISLTNVFPGAPLYTSVYLASAYPELAGVDVRPMPLDHVPFLRRNHRVALPFLPFAYSTTTVEADVVVCSSSGWAHGIRTEAPKVVYCHNPPRWLYQRHEYANTRKRYWLASAALNLPLRAWDQRAAHSCDVYVANSSAVADRIKRVYGFESEVVSPPTVFDASAPQEPVPGIEPGYVVAVNRLLGYKNVAQVVAAFADLPRHRLVVVGDGPLRHELEQHATPNVTLTGRVNDAQLRWLYANSAGLVSASFEDFGLTPVEAALYGKPCALLRAGGFLDTTIEGVTGLFFDAPDPRQIADAVRALLSEDWDAIKIATTAERYSEAGFARRMVEIVADAARR